MIVDDTRAILFREWDPIDLDGRPIQLSQATGNAASPWRSTTTAYNAAGKPIKVTKPDGKTTTYDCVMRKSTETSSSGRQVSYSYSASSKIFQIIDGVGGALDPSITVNLGAVIRETHTYYIVNGQLASLTDGKGNTLNYYYDKFDRFAEKKYPDGSYELIGYDAADNKIGVLTRSIYVISYTYDALNRLSHKIAANEPGGVLYGYDYTGRVTGLWKDVDANPYLFGYDTAGRAISQKQPNGGVVSWTVDADGNRTSLTWPETGALAYSTSYAYDAMNRLTDVFEGPASAGVRLGHYTYDALSQRTGVAYGGTAAAPVATTAATYTSAGQIAQLIHTFNGSSLTLGYAYNQDHQRTGVSASDSTFLVSGLTATNHKYAPNSLNEYASVDASTYSYDKNGNLTSDGVRTYAYNTQNLLLSATSGGSTVTYDYDAQNLRRAKTVSGTTTNYLNVPTSLAPAQGSSQGQSIDPTTFGFTAGNQEIAEYDGAGNLLRRYVYGPGLDEPLVTIDAAGNHSYHFTDALGSVIALTNRSGQVTERHAYSAYGLANSTAGTAFQFAGRRVDPETGLYYNRARYYSPLLGRFLQTDPIGTKGGINLYAYAGNDPVNLMDPTGLYSNLTQNLGSSSNSLLSPTFSQCLVSCAADHYGITALGGGTTMAGLPFPKSWIGAPTVLGASPYTNALSALGFTFPSLDARIGVNILGTTRLLGIAGRAAPFVGAGLLLYDAGSIGVCTYQCMNSMR